MRPGDTADRGFRDDLPRREVRETVFVWSRQAHAWVCQTCGGYVGDYQKHGGCKHDGAPPPTGR